MERSFIHADRRITQADLAKAEEPRKAQDEQADRYIRHARAQLDLCRRRDGIADAVVSGEPGPVVEEEFIRPNRQLPIARLSPSLDKMPPREPPDRRPVQMPLPEPSPFLPVDRLEREGDHRNFAALVGTGQKGPVRDRLGPPVGLRRRIDGQDPGYAPPTRFVGDSRFPRRRSTLYLLGHRARKRRSGNARLRRRGGRRHRRRVRPSAPTVGVFFEGINPLPSTSQPPTKRSTPSA